MGSYYSYIYCTFSFQTTKRASIRQRIDRRNSHANVFYSVLIIDQAQNKDKGLYTCHVKSGPTLKSVNTSVHIYGKQVTPCFLIIVDLGSSAKQVTFHLAKRYNAMNEYDVVPCLPLTTKQIP